MKLSNNYSKVIFKRIAFRILIYSIVFTAIFVFLLYIGITLSDNYIWQPYDPLYSFLIGIRNNIPFIWSLGIILILFFYLRKALKYIDYVMDASEKLLSNNDEYIELPRDLNVLANRLNASKAEALRNALLAKSNEERKNELIVYLAHDLKTPLTSIIGYLELLKEAPELPINQKAKYIGITLDKANRLEDLINEFFEIARFNVGSVLLNKTNLNLKLLLEQVVDEFYPVSKNENKEIIIECKNDINIFADPDKISRVFNNILKNAISYSFANSKINITAFKNTNDNKVNVTIKNEGNTIPKEKIDYIFEKFYRLDDARSTNSGGSGLGLAIAKEIVQAHGGTIFANSENNITTFTVIL